MQFLSSGPDDPNSSLVNQDLVPAENSPFQDPPRQPYVMQQLEADQSGGGLNPGRLLRKYWLLLAGLMILGAAAGFTSVVLSAPKSRGRLLMEVQNSNANLLKNMA